jgi:hypothetical protein
MGRGLSDHDRWPYPNHFNPGLLLKGDKSLGPKTRKVVVAEAGQNAGAIDVLGWLTLQCIAEAQARTDFPDISPARAATASASPSAISTTLDVGDEFILGLQKLRPQDWGSVGGLYQKASASPELEAARLEALGEAVARIWKRNKGRLRDAAAKYPGLSPFLQPGKK